MPTLDRDASPPAIRSLWTLGRKLINLQTRSPLPFALGSVAIVGLGFCLAIVNILLAGREWGPALIHSAWILFAASCLGVLSCTGSLIVRLTWYGTIIWIAAVGILVWISVWAFALSK